MCLSVHVHISVVLIVLNDQVILKSGDDPRQDQLILQLILLMDRLLRRENLDLKLIPFKVLACSSTFGECMY